MKARRLYGSPAPDFAKVMAVGAVDLVAVEASDLESIICKRGSEPLVRLLLQHGALVDLQDTHGNTPLWRATFNCSGSGEVIELLLAYGADKGRKNHHGVSPLDLAKTIGNVDVARFFSYHSQATVSARGRRPEWMRKVGLTVGPKGVACQQIWWTRL